MNIDPKPLQGKLIQAAKYGTPVVLIAFAAWLIWAPPARVGYAPEQPISYSHQLHAGEYNIDCQYCHTGVTIGKKAGVPSMNTCMNCHINVGYNKPGVKKLKKFYEEKKNLDWVRIYNMPDHVRFSHAPHLKQLMKDGKPTKEACVPCHGDVANMKVVEQVTPMNMGWCVNCHRDYRNNAEYKNHGVNINCNTCHY